MWLHTVKHIGMDDQSVLVMDAETKPDYSVEVFNHCQLKEACTHVRCFTEFLRCDSDHETTPFNILHGYLCFMDTHQKSDDGASSLSCNSVAALTVSSIIFFCLSPSGNIIQ